VQNTAAIHSAVLTDLARIQQRGRLFKHLQDVFAVLRDATDELRGLSNDWGSRTSVLASDLGRIRQRMLSLVKVDESNWLPAIKELPPRLESLAVEVLRADQSSSARVVYDALTTLAKTLAEVR
jgi:hypothetical protein